MSFDKNSDSNRRMGQILARADQALSTLSNPISIDDSEIFTTPEPLNSKSVSSRTLALDVEFGRTRLPLSEITHLHSGAILPLGCPLTPQVSLYCGDHLVAEGEILVQNDRVTVRITRKFPLIPTDGH